MTVTVAELKQPIVLVGTHRSGTTMLGKFFAQHPDIAYWEEPRHVWTWGNAYTDDDVLTDEHATERVSGHIRSEFTRFVREQPGGRFLEKTPSNCLRLRFVHAVLPDARFIHIVRDGRAVIRSTEEILQAGMPMKRLVRRARETPVREWPAYASRAAKAVGRKLSNKPLDYWGPRPPGWKDWPAQHPPLAVAALQWAGTVGRAIEDARQIPDDQYRQIRYEDLMTDPVGGFRELCRFADLPEDDGCTDYITQNVDPSRAGKWQHALDEQTLSDLRPLLEPTLDKLGYQW